MNDFTVWQPNPYPRYADRQPSIPRSALVAGVVGIGILGSVWLASSISLPSTRRAELERQRDAAVGQLTVTRVQLERAQKLLDFSARFGVDAGLATLIHDVAISEGVDPELAFRLVDVESNFNPRAISAVGAIGLAQVMPQTATFFDNTTREMLFEPEVNLRIGFRHLNYLLDRYEGDAELALLAYNRGATRVAQLIEEGYDPRNGYARAIIDGE